MPSPSHPASVSQEEPCWGHRGCRGGTYWKQLREQAQGRQGRAPLFLVPQPAPLNMPACLRLLLSSGTGP